jgi:hypothetical protein
MKTFLSSTRAARGAVLYPQLLGGAIKVAERPVDRSRDVVHVIEEAPGVPVADAAECVPNG